MSKKSIFVALVSLLLGALVFSPFTPTIQRAEASASYIVKTGADTDSTWSPSQRKLAKTSDGHLHVVYHRKDASGIFQIYHAESADGRMTWAEEPVTSESNDQVYPAIAVDSSNNLHVVWQGKYSGSPTVRQIRYCKKTLSGWQAVQNLTNEAIDYGGYPAIAVDGNNYIHIVWGGFRGPDTACPHIRYLKYTTGWQPIDDSIQEGVGYNEALPAIAVDGNNYIHVVWMSGGYHSQAQYHLVYRRYTTSWQPSEGLEPNQRSSRRSFHRS